MPISTVLKKYVKKCYVYKGGFELFSRWVPSSIVILK